ncbi:hypothetical protein TNCV_144791 [Trichonephila clavipes]|nr:hypothetical protein TNCV_144791 [Trichonephila clavipes]
MFDSSSFVNPMPLAHADTPRDILQGGTSQVLDESRSFFRVHTGYFSNIPKCIKAEFIASWDVLSPVLYRAPSVRINLIVCLIELCTSFELRDKFGGARGTLRQTWIIATTFAGASG